MKITAFLGSPRPQGNTDILAKHVLNGAKEAGLDVETIKLRRLKIKPCTGCEKCWQRDGRPCARKDSMLDLYQKIAESDILLFATPVYWYAPTAIMKAFIDRLVPFNRPEGRPLIQGKRVILVTAYEEEGPTAAEPMLRMFDLSFQYLELKTIGRIIADGVGPKGAVLEKPEILNQAYELGLSLSKEWRGSVPNE
jgi:multimeric flavodoxin WrbA